MSPTVDASLSRRDSVGWGTPTSTASEHAVTALGPDILLTVRSRNPGLYVVISALPVCPWVSLTGGDNFPDTGGSRRRRRVGLPLAASWPTLPAMLAATEWPADLPAASLIEAGLASLRSGGRDDAALLVCVGASELRRLGIDVPDFETPAPSAELCLYLSLAERHGDDAHNQYNSLIQQLVSFERALSLENRRAELTRAGDA